MANYSNRRNCHTGAAGNRGRLHGGHRAHSTATRWTLGLFASLSKTVTKGTSKCPSTEGSPTVTVESQRADKPRTEALRTPSQWSCGQEKAELLRRWHGHLSGQAVLFRSLTRQTLLLRDASQLSVCPQRGLRSDSELSQVERRDFREGLWPWVGRSRGRK